MSVLGIFSGKPQHPLVDPKEAKRICADLSAREPLSALEEAVAWFEALIEYEDIKLPLRIERLSEIDDVVTPQARRLMRTYITQMSSPGSHQGAETGAWKAGHNYWLLIAAAYTGCIARYDAPGLDSDSKKAAKSMLLHVYARLMHALAECRKWEQFHYKPAGADFWAAAGGLYLRAVSEKLESREIRLYPGQGVSSIEQQYLKALLLQSSSTDKLSLVEIELADRLLAHFLPWFIFTRELRRDNMYWVDLSKPLPPARLAKLPEASDSLRFFSGGGALAVMGELIDVIKRERQVPAKITLDIRFDVDTVIRVLAHLSLYWSPTPPTRSHVRRPIKAAIAVTHGLASSYRHILDQSPAEIGLCHWQAEDISLGGLSAKIAEGRQEWVKIGVLVAVRPEGGSNWLVGIVRRYVRVDARQGSVGIQTLSRSPRSVVADAGGIETEALLLDLPVVGEYVRMALPPAALEDKVALEFLLDDTKVRLHPREVLERGPGFVVANFLVQSCTGIIVRHEVPITVAPTLAPPTVIPSAVSSPAVTPPAVIPPGVVPSAAVPSKDPPSAPQPPVEASAPPPVAILDSAAAGVVTDDDGALDFTLATPVTAPTTSADPAASKPAPAP